MTSQLVIVFVHCFKRKKMHDYSWIRACMHQPTVEWCRKMFPWRNYFRMCGNDCYTAANYFESKLKNMFPIRLTNLLEVAAAFPTDRSNWK